MVDENNYTKLIAQSDQLFASYRDIIAPGMWGVYQKYIELGFPEERAFALTMTHLHRILSSNRPKERL